MTVHATSDDVEQRVARLLRDAPPTELPTLQRAADSIAAALQTMRFQRRYDDTGPFRFERFGTGTPVLPVGPMWPGLEAALASPRARPAVVDMLVALDAWQRHLVYEADCAEYIDAHHTCRFYLQAAGHVDLAAAALLSLV